VSRWIPIADAAIIAHRSPRTIYSWIDRDLLVPKQGEQGETLVDGVAVLRVEEGQRRGRPRKDANAANAAL
jgi:hypothetical protein